MSRTHSLATLFLVLVLGSLLAWRVQSTRVARARAISAGELSPAATGR